MAPQFLFLLLGICPLLSQPSRAAKPSWMDEVIKACGRELIRVQIDICGRSTLGRKARSLEDASLAAGLSADTDRTNMISEFMKNLPKELKVALSERELSSPELQPYRPVSNNPTFSFEELKTYISNRRRKVDDNIPSESKSLGLHTQSRKKRQFDISPVLKCCQVGCTKGYLARWC